jgi:fimbrial chaperone protein
MNVGRIGLAVAGLVTASLLCLPAFAAAIRVTPVLVQAAGGATSIEVANAGTTPVNVQIRVFRWVQQNGEDVLLPTTDVVVSPPIATLQGGAENVVRIVRIATTPVQGEESYRILVDELPNPMGQGGGVAVNMVVRQSIPVFFGASGPPQIGWSVAPASGGYRITATNTGATRLRIANLGLTDPNGRVVAVYQGLAGYVLSGSTMTWLVTGSGLAGGQQLTISGDGEAGRFNATVRLQGG